MWTHAVQKARLCVLFDVKVIIVSANIRSLRSNFHWVFQVTQNSVKFEFWLLFGPQSGHLSPDRKIELYAHNDVVYDEIYQNFTQTYKKIPVEIEIPQFVVPILYHDNYRF